jgi:hypothetical protein
MLAISGDFRVAGVEVEGKEAFEGEGVGCAGRKSEVSPSTNINRFFAVCLARSRP